MINSYELALTTGKTFLSTFMKKSAIMKAEVKPPLTSSVSVVYRCCGGKEEDDFRPLFDNFVQDLLTTLNLPEWPASEVLLTLLGVLLVSGVVVDPRGPEFQTGASPGRSTHSVTVAMSTVCV